MHFCFVPAGRFIMGSNHRERAESPQRPVELAYPCSVTRRSRNVYRICGPRDSPGRRKDSASVLKLVESRVIPSHTTLG